ncbi:hypothetical protein ACUNV4_21025 [Granulosicoccus sp. 3-233]|uniref:hypothetical protein n=1 Tax=Granulosicoccus sp. 3-233 TaxID=3417969 RepID=UPI003D32F61B
MISRIPGKAFLLVALSLCIPAAWISGRFQSQALSREQLRLLQASAEQEQLQLQNRVESLQSDLRQQALSLEVAEARAASLQVRLDDSAKQSMDDKAELALYRRIEGTESEWTIRVDELTRTSAAPEALSITLVQARGRERASGAIAVTLLANQAGVDQRWILTDSELDPLVRAAVPQAPSSGEWREDELLASSLSDDVVKVAFFDLRFFQTLLVKAKNITTINPDYVEIWILPEGKRLKPHVQRFRWSEIAFDQ